MNLPEHLQALARRALRRELTEDDAAQALAWMYDSGGEDPAIEALLLPIAGDRGFARALAAQNRFDDAHESACRDVFVDANRGSPERDVRGVLSRALPVPLRLELEREGTLGEASRWGTSPVAVVAKAAAAEAAPSAGRVTRFFDGTSGLTVQLTAFHAGLNEAALELAVEGLGQRGARVSMYSGGAAGRLFQAGDLEDFAYRVRVPAGNYLIRVRVRDGRGEISLDVPLEIRAGE